MDFSFKRVLVNQADSSERGFLRLEETLKTENHGKLNRSTANPRRFHTVIMLSGEWFSHS